MNNKKMIIIPILAIAVFSLLVFGAAYSWFAANTTGISNITNLNASLPEFNSVVSTSSTDCNLTISAANMLLRHANNTTPVATTSCNLSVTVNGTSNVPYVYGVVLEDVSEDRYYDVVGGNSSFAPEFKYSVRSSETTGMGNNTYFFTPDVSSNKYIEYYTTNTISNVYFIDEYYDSIDNIDYSYTEGNLPNITDNMYDTHVSNNRIAPIAVAVISVPEGQNTYTQTYTFTGSWYNLEGVDQAVHADKDYSFRLKVIELTDYIIREPYTGPIYRTTSDFVAIGTALSPQTGWCGGGSLSGNPMDSCRDFNLRFNSEAECIAMISYIGAVGSCYQGRVSGYSNYSTVDNIPSGAYLKHDVINDYVVASYACIKYTENNTLQEKCVKGVDTSAYGSYDGMSSDSTNNIYNPTGNIRVIQSAQNYFINSLDGSCLYSSNDSSCSSSSLGLYSHSDGDVRATDNNKYCRIEAATNSYCY